jgi:hypothetical protein
MNQAFYENMNNKIKMKKKKDTNGKMINSEKKKKDMDKSYCHKRL